MAESPTLIGEHPDFSLRRSVWVKDRDAYEGEDKIKSRGQVYLRATSGQIEDGAGQANAEGEEAYQAYKDRATYPDWFQTTVDAVLGVMHDKEAIFNVPDRLKGLKTADGENLLQALMRINFNQLVTGRLGLMLDVEPGTDVNGLPYIAFYEEKDAPNWDEGGFGEKKKLTMVGLDETEHVRDGFDWKEDQKYRVLYLKDGKYTVEIKRENASEEIQPEFAGNPLDEIPFVFCNLTHISARTEKPVFDNLANLALKYYKKDADYCQTLFMQGQDTFYFLGPRTNPNEKLRTGAGAKVESPDHQTKVGFAGVSSTGLPEQRMALENTQTRANDIGGRFLESHKKTAESGAALHIRSSARTASITQIALTGAEALTQILKLAGKWIGLPQEEIDGISVDPHTHFSYSSTSPDELVKLMTAKQLNAKLSHKSIHTWMQDKSLTEMTYEEEMQQIEEEGPDLEFNDQE